jgi:hypothetical protein
MSLSEKCRLASGRYLHLLHAARCVLLITSCTTDEKCRCMLPHLVTCRARVGAPLAVVQNFPSPQFGLFDPPTIDPETHPSPTEFPVHYEMNVLAETCKISTDNVSFHHCIDGVFGPMLRPIRPSKHPFLDSYAWDTTFETIRQVKHSPS